jgi:hypothetical protein
MTLNGKLSGALFTECAEWIWEQLQEDGFYLSGELVELILQTERELGVQARTLPEIAQVVADEFQVRGVAGNPSPIDARSIEQVLLWEDDFLGFAGIRRAES